MMTTRTRTVPTEAIVTTNLAHPVLLSWHDLIRLKVIDENFPLSATIVAVNTRLDILDAYPTVFKGYLTSLWPLTTDPWWGPSARASLS